MPQFNSASFIFPKIQSLPQVLGDPRLRTDVLLQIQNGVDTYAAFRSLTLPEQEAFLDFCVGERGLKVTYDPFFKHIFHPEARPGRLDRLLSCILDQEITVRKILPLERRLISENSSLIIMDILVQLADGCLVNVEMQRVGYEFPIERSFCYGADLLVRQYDVVREGQGKNFSYRSINPAYVIVLMETSPGIFHQYPDKYIHRSSFSFDTGLNMKSLQNFIYVSLDIFREMEHNNLTELEAWLYFLGSDNPADILRVVSCYPFFQELYQEIINFRFHPKELIFMYSEALRVMDQNTIEYMIDELKAEISAQKDVLAQKDSVLLAQKNALSQKDSEIEQLRTLLAMYEQKK